MIEFETIGHNEKRPREGGEIRESVKAWKATESNRNKNDSPLDSPQSQYRQSDTLMSPCGRKGPAYQSTQVEFPAKMPPYRALRAGRIGTTGTGPPEYSLGYTIEERAVID